MISTPLAPSAPVGGQLLSVGAPRILYVATTRHYGGLELASIRLADLLTRTAADRMEIVFACRPGMPVEQECRRLGIETVPLIVRNSADFGGARDLEAIIERRQIDIVHVHSRRDYVVGTVAAARLRRRRRASDPKLVLHMHLLRNLGSPAALCGYLFAPNVDRFLAVSSAVRDRVLDCHRQIRPEQVVVVPNSVDVNRFQRDAGRGRQVRDLCGIPAGHFVIGMVGRLDAKGQDKAIAAVASLKRRDVHLLLVGAEGDRGTLTHLRKLARRFGAADNTIFCGPQDDIPGYLSAMDILLHLPVDEAFGLAPAEAMAAGTPTIVSRVGGCVELVRDGETGLIVDPRDRSAIRQALERLIASAPLRERLAGAGSRFVRDRFSTLAQAQALTVVYRDITEGPNRPERFCSRWV